VVREGGACGPRGVDTQGMGEARTARRGGGQEWKTTAGTKDKREDKGGYTTQQEAPPHCFCHSASVIISAKVYAGFKSASERQGGSELLRSVKGDT